MEKKLLVNIDKNLMSTSLLKFNKTFSESPGWP